MKALVSFFMCNWKGALVCALIALMLADLCSGKIEKSSGLIVDKIHQEAYWHWVGDSKHRHVERVPEKWYFMVENGKESIVKVHCEPYQFYSTESGNVTSFKTWRGGFTRIPYRRWAISNRSF